MKKKTEEYLNETINNQLITGCSHHKYPNGRKYWKFNIICTICKKERLVNSQTVYSGEIGCFCAGGSKSSFRKKNPSRYLQTLKQELKRRKQIHGFDIDLDFIMNLLKDQNSKCALSGINISLEDGTASLDRIDNKIGYLRGNVQWVHRSINYMKNELDQSSFIHFCKEVSKNNQ